MENVHISSVAAANLRPIISERPAAWRRAGSFGQALIASGVGAFLVAIVVAGSDPGGLSFVIPMVAITGGTAWAVATRGRWAQVLSAVVALAMGALLAPMATELAFDSFFDFAPLIAALSGVAIALAAAAADLSRRPAGGQLTRLLPAGAIALLSVLFIIGAASAVATVAGRKTLSASERAGMSPVGMKDVKFAPDRITATEGDEVRIALKNSDPVIHDLRVSSLDLKFTVKPGSERAISFTAPAAGTYQFDCSLHPNMKGVLEVLSK